MALALALAAIFSACQARDPQPTDAGAAGTIAASGGSVAVADPRSRLSGAKVSLPAFAGPALAVTIARGALTLPPRYRALGVPVAFGPRTRKLPAVARFELPFEPASLPKGARLSQIDVLRLRPERGDAHAPPFMNLRARPERGVVEFEAEELTTYQLAIRDDAGEPFLRRHTFRAMAGVSMGATGAASLGFRHHDRFDVIAPLGGYIDWIYFAHFAEKYFLGGFCKVGGPCRVGEDFPGMPPSELPMQPDEDFNHFVPNFNGGNFDRSDFIGFFRDFAYAYGNLAYWSPDSTYFPPGVPASYASLSAAARCDGPGPVRVSGICNAEYNPDGRYRAIPICDGEDGPPAGAYDPTKPHREPAEVLLAFDVNESGQRDFAEPVFMNARERWDDVGRDGVPSEREVGRLGAYDPVTNPDPAGDDYHWFYNPDGTEKNWMWDEGEPFADLGLDGVRAGGLCAADYGEGNGRYDVSPNLRRYFEHSARTWLSRMSPDELARVRVWIDGGIRDFAGSLVTGQQVAGALSGLGANLRQWRDFRYLLPSPQDYFDIAQVDADIVGRHVLMNYGKLDPTPQELDDGDGMHVGTPEQALYRFLALFRFIDQGMPGGDYAAARFGDASAARNEVFFSPAVSVCRDAGSRACYTKSSRRACATDDQCPAGEGCFFGACRRVPPGSRRSCSGDEACPAGEMCMKPTCVSRPRACSADAQCGVGEACEERSCVRDNNCEAGEACVYGVCRKRTGSQNRCTADAQCGGGEVCFGDRTYLVVLPPGYDDPENAQKRYPVVYILHGYGQEPQDLAATVLLTAAFMSSGVLQKMIFVYPDGKCYLGECKKANWYVDQPAGPDGVSKFAYEKSVLELIDHVDRTYRTKREAILPDRR